MGHSKCLDQRLISQRLHFGSSTTLNVGNRCCLAALPGFLAADEICRLGDIITKCLAPLLFSLTAVEID